MLDAAISRISLIMARIGGGLLVASAILVSVEVVLRKAGVLAFSLGTELSSYALAVAATWSFAFVLLMRGHVRIDIISQRLPQKPRAMLNVLAVASVAAVGAILSWTALQTLITSLTLGAYSNTPLATPLSVPQGLWTFGLVWFTLVAVYLSIRLILALARGDHATVERLAAPATADAEADEAANDARGRMARQATTP